MSIYLRGDIWHVYLARGGKRMRASLRTSDQAEARRRAAAMEGALLPALDPAAWVFSEAWLSERLWAMRQRGKRYSEPCMDREALQAIVARSGGRCELTGIPFSAVKPLGSKRAPFAPSVDRIDARKGYSAENCRLVCFAVNVALNQWGDSVTRRIALGFVAKEGTFCATAAENPLMFHGKP